MIPTTKLNWLFDIQSRLEDVLQHAQPGDFAVFDFDNTCILGDIGDMVFHHFVENMSYRFDDPRFWACFDEEDRPDLLKKRVGLALSVLPEDRASDPAYHAYLGHMSGLYQAHDARHGHEHAYLWVVRLMVGMDPDAVLEGSRQAYESQLLVEVGVEQMPDTLTPGQTIAVPRGVRVCHEMRTLMSSLRQAGVAVWIVSASARLWVVPFASVYGVPDAQVLGNRLVLDDDGVFNDVIGLPKSYRQGKVDLIKQFIDADRPPIMAGGDAMTDFEMLSYASRLALVMDRGNKVLHKHATDSGWAIQPRHVLTFTT